MEAFVPDRLVHGKLTYLSSGRCTLCGQHPQSVVMAPGGLQACRSCYMDIVELFDRAARMFQLDRSGIPALPAPPVQEAWVVTPATSVRIGVARFVREVSVDRIEIGGLALFPDGYGSTRVDVAVTSWKGAWTPVGLGGVNHIRKHDPPEMLESVRFAIVLPDDLESDTFEIDCRRL